MASLLGTILADFTTQLATEISVGGTTATLSSATDDDGVALPAGRYFFTIDGANSSKEHISCTLSGTSLTSIKSVSRQGVETSGVARKHRIGASVTITDFAHILQINNLLNGTTDLNASTPLEYDGTATISSANQLATKDYVDGVAIAGSPDASTTVKGISKLSTAPVSASNPIAVGDNDGRVPTQSENDALVGTSGTPSSSNKYVTNDDVSNSGASGKIVRLNATAYPAGDGSSITKATNLGITRLAGYSPASNTSENTVWSTTITGGLLSSSGVIRARTPIQFSSNATSETWTIRLKFGGSTLQTLTVSSPAIGGGIAVTVCGFIDILIANNAATNSQNVGAYITLAPQFSSNPTNSVIPTASHASDTTSAIDTTSNQTLTITVQRTNGSGGTGQFYQTIVETIYK
jgi:hypothetical protein